MDSVSRAALQEVKTLLHGVSRKGQTVHESERQRDTERHRETQRDTERRRETQREREREKSHYPLVGILQPTSGIPLPDSGK